MAIDRQISVAETVSILNHVFDTVTPDNVDQPTNQNLIRNAIYTVTGLVTGLNPEENYSLDTLMEIISTFRADVLDALGESGLVFSMAALNSGSIIAEVSHVETGKNIHCNITGRYNSDELASAMSSKSPVKDYTIH